jgi:hypothetical protein
MPGRAMAANAGVLRTRSVRLVLARSVTTTLAPAAAHSFLSLHRTCRGSQAEALAVAVAWAGAPAGARNRIRIEEGSHGAKADAFVPGDLVD